MTRVQMKINPITVKQIPTIHKTQVNKNTYMSFTGADSFKAHTFNKDTAIKELQEIKYGETEQLKPKFAQYQLDIMSTILESEPDKWNAVKSLAHNPKISGEFVYLMSMQPTDKLNDLKDIAEIKNPDGKYKFTGKQLINLNDNTTTEGLSTVKSLAYHKVDVKNLIAISEMKKLPDMAKIENKVDELEKFVGKNLESITFSKDKYADGEYVISAKTNDKKTYSELLDKNLKRMAVENIEEVNENNEKVFIKKTTDYRNNTTSKVRLLMDEKVGTPYVTHEIRVEKDSNNNIVKTITAKPSQVKGVFDISSTDKNGNVTVISSGTIDKKTGITSIKKNMESLDGTKTNYLYENDPEGNRILDYKITDKNGKVLLQNSETFEVLSPTKFKTSKNNEEYEINVKNNGISVKDLKNPEKTAEFTFDKEIKGNQKAILNTLKQLSGGELLKLSRTTNVLKSIDDSLDSFYNGSDGTIYTGDSEFLLLHELGHAVDFEHVDATSADAYELSMLEYAISCNDDVNKIYNEELTAFNKAFPEAQRNHIDYFINQLNHQGGEYGAIGETIAESNALINSTKTHYALTARSQYLQQYFPRTIAEVAKRLG